jgi:competence protein ComEA
VLYLIISPPRGEAVILLPPPTQADSVAHVTGAVIFPGVYVLPPGSRVLHAVEAAGGFSPEANINSINLAEPVRDGDRIYIQAIYPTQDVSERQIASTPTISDLEKPININSADSTTLELLPGIGPAIAGRIIAYREEFGLFREIEDIQNVAGIGPVIFNKIKDLITVINP